MPAQSHDLIIVGGGMAGLTAGIYAARAGLSVQVLEKEISHKTTAILAADAGGTMLVNLDSTQQQQEALSSQQIDLLILSFSSTIDAVTLG